MCKSCVRLSRFLGGRGVVSSNNRAKSFVGGRRVFLGKVVVRRGEGGVHLKSRLSLSKRICGVVRTGG